MVHPALIYVLPLLAGIIVQLACAQNLAVQSAPLPVIEGKINGMDVVVQGDSVAFFSGKLPGGYSDELCAEDLHCSLHKNNTPAVQISPEYIRLYTLDSPTTFSLIERFISTEDIEPTPTLTTLHTGNPLVDQTPGLAWINSETLKLLATTVQTVNFLATSTSSSTDDDFALINPSVTEGLKVMTTITGELDELRKRLMSSANTPMPTPTPMKTIFEDPELESDEIQLETEFDILLIRPSPSGLYKSSGETSAFTFTVKQVGTSAGGGIENTSPTSGATSTVHESSSTETPQASPSPARVQFKEGGMFSASNCVEKPRATILQSPLPASLPCEISTRQPQLNREVVIEIRKRISSMEYDDRETVERLKQLLDEYLSGINNDDQIIKNLSSLLYCILPYCRRDSGDWHLAELLIELHVKPEYWREEYCPLTQEQASNILPASPKKTDEVLKILKWFVYTNDISLIPLLKHFIDRNPGLVREALENPFLIEVTDRTNPLIVAALHESYEPFIYQQAAAELDDLSVRLKKKIDFWHRSSIRPLLFLLNAMASHDPHNIETLINSNKLTHQQWRWACGLCCMLGLSVLVRTLRENGIDPDFQISRFTDQQTPPCKTMLHHFDTLSNYDVFRQPCDKILQCYREHIPGELWYQLDNEGLSPLGCFLNRIIKYTIHADYESPSETRFALMLQCCSGTLPGGIIPALKGSPKTWFWASCLVILVVNGLQLGDISNVELGLDDRHHDDDPEDYRPLLGSVVNKIRECDSFKSVADLSRFMDWLIMLDIPATHPAPSGLYPGAGLFRPEARSLDSASSDQVTDLISQGPDSERYMMRHHNIVYEWLRSALDTISPDTACEVVRGWLMAPNNKDIRGKLYNQRFYAPNCNYYERFLWNLPVIGLFRQLPPLSENAVAKHYRDREPSAADSGPSAPADATAIQQLFQDKTVACFGRTLKVTDSSANRYLKLQRLRESDQDFVRQAEKIQFFTRHQQALKLEGIIPEGAHPFRICLHELLKSEGLDARQNRQLQAAVGNHSPLAYYFWTSPTVHYDHYPYSLPWPERKDAVLEGLNASARNIGRLWRKGFLAPEVMAAYHNPFTRRLQVTLGVLFDMTTQGSLNQWRGESSNYPNVGPWPVPTRDMGDCRLLEEIDIEKYHERYVLSPDSLGDRNRVYLNELAKNYQGLILQLARVCYRELDHKNEDRHQWLKEEIRKLTINCFSEAFSMDRDYCNRLLEQDQLLEWTTMDIQYWCAEHAGISADLRNNCIPESVYPGWGDCFPNPEHKNKILIKDDGLYLCKAEKTPVLGFSSLPFALLALDGLTAKMLSYGILHLTGEHSQEAVSE